MDTPPDWEMLDGELPEDGEIMPQDFDEDSYFDHEQNLRNDWNEDEEEPFFEEGEQEEILDIPTPIAEKKQPSEGEKSEILLLHSELLKSGTLTKDQITKETECINHSFFEGYCKEEGIGLFPEGMNMSLWSDGTDENLFLVGTSGAVSFVGLLREQKGKFGSLQCELGFGDTRDRILQFPLIFYLVNRTQEFIGLLNKWAKYVDSNAPVGILDRYLTLTNYKVDGARSSNSWRYIEEIQNPLLYLIRSSMVYHRGKTSMDKGNEELKEWIDQNTGIPRQD